jgi:membrane protein
MAGWIRAFYDAYWAFADDDGWAISSHIALSTLTSMFPFLIFLTSLAGFFGSKDLADQAATMLLEAWPQRVAQPLATEIHSVLTQSRSGLLTVGVVLALYFSSSGIEALRIGLNRAYSVKDKRAWWLLRLESIAYVLVGSLALLALTFLVVLGPLIWNEMLTYAPALQPLDQMVTWGRYVITAFILTVALLVAHKWLPAERHTFRQIAPGVIFTLALSLVFGFAFGAYLAGFARNYASTYAGLASVMIALVFLYMLASIFVYGGELNAAICRLKKVDESKPAREGRAVQQPR